MELAPPERFNVGKHPGTGQSGFEPLGHRLLILEFRSFFRAFFSFAAAVRGSRIVVIVFGRSVHLCHIVVHRVVVRCEIVHQHQQLLDGEPNLVLVLGRQSSFQRHNEVVGQ